MSIKTTQDLAREYEAKFISESSSAVSRYLEGAITGAELISLTASMVVNYDYVWKEGERFLVAPRILR